MKFTAQIKSNLPVILAKANVERAKLEKPPLTVADLSKELDCAYTTVQRLHENTAKRVDFLTIAKVCEFFGCEIGDLLVVDVDEAARQKAREIEEYRQAVAEKFGDLAKMQ